jgi:hypothetical protein
VHLTAAPNLRVNLLSLSFFFFFYKKNCGGVCIKELASRRGLL